MKNKFFYFFLFVFKLTFSQEDSLIQLYQKAAQDTTLINVSNELASYYYRKNPQKNLDFARKALVLSEKNKYNKGKALSLSNIGSYYVSINKLDSAFVFFSESKSLSIKGNYKKEEAIVYNRLGVYYFYLGNTDSAIHYFVLSGKIFEAINDPVESCKIQNNLGAIFLRKGDFNKALTCFFKCLQFDETRNSQANIASDYNNIGTALIEKKDLAGASVFLTKSINIRRVLQDTFGLTNTLTNLLTVLHKENKNKEAIAYANKHRSFFTSSYYNKEYASFLANLGMCYTGINLYDSALNCLISSIEIKNHLGDISGLSSAYGNIGQVYLNQKLYLKAIPYFLKSIDYAQQSKDLDYQVNAFNNLTQCYIGIGDKIKSQECLTSYTRLKDSLYRSQNIKEATEAKEKYETEKKETELKIKSIELEKQKQNSFYLKIIFISSLLILLFIFLLVYSKYRAKQKQAFKEELHRQEQIRYKAVISSLENERNRIASELHDNSGALISFITSKSDWALQNESESQEALIQIKNTSQEVMTSIRETLWTLNTKSIKNVDLTDKLKLYIKKHSVISSKIDDTITHEVVLPNDVVLSLYRCVQEIINNGNKHSKALSLKIQFYSTEKVRFGFIYCDNGIGFSRKSNEESYGIRNIIQRIEKIGASVQFDSPKEGGVRIEIKY